MEILNIIDLLKKAMLNRQSNGDFNHFVITSLDNVSIEMENGRNYRLHTNEINHIIKCELESISEYVDQLLPKQ